MHKQINHLVSIRISILAGERTQKKDSQAPRPRADRQGSSLDLLELSG
jgi:hypothetical protein